MNSKLTIKKDPVKGRGVYAEVPFAKGEIIEVCELLFISLSEVPDELESYVYEYSKDKAAIALGNGSLLNHSDQNNADFHFDYRKRQLRIKAIKEIKKGDEITINYGYDSAAKNKFNIK